MDCPGVLWVVGVNLGNGLAGVTGGAGALIEGAGVLEGGAGVLEGGAEVLEEGAEELMGGAPYLPPSFFLHKIFKVHPSARFGKYCPLGARLRQSSETTVFTFFLWTRQDMTRSQL